MTECTNDTTRCLHCSEAHNAGSRECAKHQKEEAIMQVQEEEKVTNLRAKQILERNNEFVEKPTRPYPTHFEFKMNEIDKRKVTP